MVTAVQETPDVVRLTDGSGLAVHSGGGALRPFVLIHDAGAGNADSDSGADDAGHGHGWDAVARRLLAAGHQVAVAGSGDRPRDGWPGTDDWADDLSTLIGRIGFVGDRRPIVVGHGWGADAALSLAARRDGVAGVGCVDGGWPQDGVTGPDRCERRAWYPLIDVPVLFCPVLRPTSGAAVAQAAAGLSRSRVSWYACDPHDGAATSADGPDRLADDLLALAIDAEPSPDRTAIPQRWWT